MRDECARGCRWARLATPAFPPNDCEREVSVRRKAGSSRQMAGWSELTVLAGRPIAPSRGGKSAAEAREDWPLLQVCRSAGLQCRTVHTGRAGMLLERRYEKTALCHAGGMR